jgi:hypothetical protein
VLDALQRTRRELLGVVVPRRDDDDETDEEIQSDLLRRLAESRGLNRTPAQVLEQASDAFTARQRESRLLELAYDSLIDSEITVETSEGPVRLLEFRGADTTVELALAPVGDRCDVVGRVDPSAVRSAQVHTPTVVLAAVVDDEGGFVVTGVPHGPMSVRLYLGDTPQRVHTDWVAV